MPRLMYALFAFALASPMALATTHTFVVPLSGAQEVLPVVGDSDGTGLATLMIDDSFTPAFIVWSIDVSNIGTVTMAHIHRGSAGANGPVVLDFNGQLGGAIASSVADDILSNPGGFYVNVHTSDHLQGAVRGQIPAPGTVALLPIAGAAMLRRRRAVKR